MESRPDSSGANCRQQLDNSIHLDNRSGMSLIPPNTVIIDHSGFPYDLDGDSRPVIRIGLICDAFPRLLLPMDHPKVAPALKMTSLEAYDAVLRPMWPDANFQQCFPGR